MRRRTFVRTAAVGAALAPLFGRVPAHAQGVRRRLLIWLSPIGTIDALWGTDGNVLREILAPIEPVRNRVTILEGLWSASAEVDRQEVGDTYRSALPNVLTASRIVSPTNISARGPSIDQAVAAQIVDTPHRSIELIAGPVNSYFGFANHRGANLPLAPESDPRSAYVRLFGNAPPPTVDRRLQAARRALDFAIGDTARARARMRSAARLPLEEHAEALRTSSARLQQPVVCTVPAPPTITNPTANESFPAVIEAHRALVVAAFACDLTRVATIQLGSPAPSTVHQWLGSSTRFHELQHRANEPDARAELVRIYQWYTAQFVELLQTLDSVADGTGTLLDHTLVVWCNTMGDCLQHSFRRVPFVVAGGLIPQGRVLRFDAPGVAHNALWVSVANVLGLPVTTFGDPAFGSGPLPGFA